MATGDGDGLRRPALGGGRGRSRGMKHAAFLRGINVGGRRLSNAELCAPFEQLGFGGVCAFLASGNVVFETRAKKGLARRIERALERDLGYEVATILRTGPELRAICEREVFDPTLVGSWGKEFVFVLDSEPGAAAIRKAKALATPDDLIEVRGSELHLLRHGPSHTSTVTLDKVVAAVGPATSRTRNTLERLTRKHFTHA